jgi:MFS family permease
MQSPAGGSRRFTTTEWLVLVVASIGFLFDTYELLLLPLIAAPAIAELLQVPANNPQVTTWVARMLWIAALSGGIFGLLGGWLTDRLGRKTVLALSIALYSLSPRRRPSAPTFCGLSSFAARLSSAFASNLSPPSRGLLNYFRTTAAKRRFWVGRRHSLR